MEGRLTTNFIAEEYPDGFNPTDTVPADTHMFFAVAAVMHAAYQSRAAQISGQQNGHSRKVSSDWIVSFADHKAEVTIIDADDGTVALNIDGKPMVVKTDWQLGEPMFRAEMDGEAMCFQVVRSTVAYIISQGGFQADALVLSPHTAQHNALMLVKEPPDTSKLLLSPMPGMLMSVAVEAGQEIKAGEELCVVEAMKMENVLRAERDGVVSEIKAEAGASLTVDQVIMEFA